MEQNSRSHKDQATGEHAVETEISALAEVETKHAQIEVRGHTINVSFLENDTKTEQMSLTVPELFEKLADHQVGPKEDRR